MSVRAILAEMAEQLEQQVEHVVAADYPALAAGAARHEELLAALEHAPLDVPPEEVQVLAERIIASKEKLQSLITAESKRVDFMLRLLLGGGAPRSSGYPGRGLGCEAASGRLNRRA